MTQTAEEVLTTIAKSLEAGFNSTERTTGFVLVTFRLGKDGKAEEVPVVNYISNTPEKETGNALKSLMSKFGFHTFEKATKIQ